MTDKKNEGALRHWLGKTKTYPNGATFSRKELIIYSAASLTALPIIAVVGVFLATWSITSLVTGLASVGLLK